jgi:hypothetical protein
MKSLFPILALVGAAVSPAAGASETRAQFNAKDVVVVEPASAYIYYRSTDAKIAAVFLRTVTDAQRAEHLKKREEALAKAREKYVRKLASWQQAVNQHEEAGPRPIEPTEENFAFPAPELDNFVFADPGRVFLNEKPHFAYLLRVEPGEYTYYGPISLFAQPMMDTSTCMCMGSVRFAAEAGKIVDLGEIGTVSTPAAETLSDKTALQFHWRIDPTSALSHLPDRLPKIPVVKADFRAADKISNYRGIMIDRLVAMPGVLAYQRDRVIDLRGNSAAPTP